MALAQIGSQIPGTIMDRGRSRPPVSKCYPAPTKKYTLVVGGTASSGVYSFLFNGTLVSFTRDAEANAAIATGLANAAKSNDSVVYDVASVSLDSLTITIEGRSAGDTFNITDETAPGSGSLTLTEVNDGIDGDIEIGIGVCLIADDPESIRRPQAGDTKIYGVLVRGSGLKPDRGDPDDVDGHEPGDSCEVLRQGIVKLTVEEAVSPGDPVYCRVAAATGKVQGQFRKSSGGVSQVTRGDVVFNGTDLVGLAVDDLSDLTVASDTSDDITLAALVAAWNASPEHWAVASASADTSGSESFIDLAFRDFATHDVAAVSPSTADVVGITNTTDAVEGAVLVPGEWTTASANNAAVADINLPA